MITVRTVIDHLRQSSDVLSRPAWVDDAQALVRIQADIPEPWQLIDRKPAGASHATGNGGTAAPRPAFF